MSAIPPQLPGSPSYLRPGTPALAVFLRDGKNHLGDHNRFPPSSLTRYNALS
jgi:arylsulfatase